MNVDSFEWLALLLAAIEAEFEIVEPAELRDYLRTTAELFLRGTVTR